MHISSKISGVHDGNNKRAYLIFHPFCVLSQHFSSDAAQVTAMICAAYEENAASRTTCKRWYQKFRQGDFSLEDESLDALKRLKWTTRLKHCWI